VDLGDGLPDDGVVPLAGRSRRLHEVGGSREDRVPPNPGSVSRKIRPMESRSAVRAVWRTLQPSSSSPTRLAAGTQALVKKTSLKWVSPLICLMGRMSTPCCLSPSILNGKKKKLRPRCLGTSQFVRAMSRPHSAVAAIEDQIFWPLMT
jgi:hypothetical protein